MQWNDENMTLWKLVSTIKFEVDLPLGSGTLKYFTFYINFYYQLLQIPEGCLLFLTPLEALVMQPRPFLCSVPMLRFRKNNHFRVWHCIQPGHKILQVPLTREYDFFSFYANLTSWSCSPLVLYLF
jgi:hypothetical protein